MIPWEEFIKVYAVLSKTYSQPVDAERSRIYFEALRQYDAETLRQAANIIIKRERFFPVPSTIILVADEILRTRRPVLQPAGDSTPADREKVRGMIAQLKSKMEMKS